MFGFASSTYDKKLFSFTTLIGALFLILIFTSYYSWIENEKTIENPLLSLTPLYLRKSNIFGEPVVLDKGRSLYNSNLLSTIQYHGGPILSSPPLQMYHLYVGDFNSNNQKVKARSFIDYLGAYIANSVWYQGIQNYYEILGSSKNNVSNSVVFMERRSLIVTSSPTEKSQAVGFSDADIQRAIKLEMQKTNGALTADSSGVYMVLFRGKYDVSDQNGKKWLKDWCGYHGNFTFNGTVIKYGVIGDPMSNSVTQPSQRCVSTSAAEESSLQISSVIALNMGSIYADTLAGILTNPTATGWYQNGPTNLEVVEICNPNFDRFANESIGYAQNVFLLPQVYRLGYGCWPNVPLTSFYPSSATTVKPSKKLTLSPSIISSVSPTYVPSIDPTSTVAPTTAMPSTVPSSTSPTYTAAPTKYLLYQCISDITCGNYSEITIPPQNLTVPVFAFSGSQTIQYVSIPTTVTAIGDAAFSLCYNLITVIIPTTISYLPVSLFLNSSSLLNVNIPTSVIAVGDLAFGGCLSLTSIILPTSLMAISYQMFLSATNLDVVFIPTSITFINSGAFSKCKVTSIILPTSVVEISASTFSSSRLSSIFIPTTITRIAYAAFFRCYNLIAVDFPTSLLSIEKQAFAESSLQRVVIPTSVKSLGVSVFVSCLVLKLVTIPTSISTLPYQSFGYTSIESVVIPTSVTFLGDAVFVECLNLLNVTIPTSITAIPYQCFYDDLALQNVIIPTSVTTIRDSAFYNSLGLLAALIPTSVQYIGANAFYYNAIEFLSIPTSVTSMGVQAFGYSYLLTLSLPTSLTEISARLFQFAGANFNLDLNILPNTFVLHIPSTITRIGNHSFEGFLGLARVVIPPSVVVIEDYAFANCPNLYCVVWNSSGVAFNSGLVFENSEHVKLFHNISECFSPTELPTESPTAFPTESPTTASPTDSPSAEPTTSIPSTSAPSESPTESPASSFPSYASTTPSFNPSTMTESPSSKPSPSAVTETPTEIPI